METSELIWQSRLDDRYEIKVARKGEYVGELTIADGDAILLTEEVGLMYGAPFGPDASDVWDWQQRAMEFVDALEEE